MARSVIIEYADSLIAKKSDLELNKGNRLQELVILYSRYIVEIGTCYYILNNEINSEKVFQDLSKRLLREISFNHKFPNIHVSIIEK